MSSESALQHQFAEAEITAITALIERGYFAEAEIAASKRVALVAPYGPRVQLARIEALCGVVALHTSRAFTVLGLDDAARDKELARLAARSTEQIELERKEAISRVFEACNEYALAGGTSGHRELRRLSNIRELSSDRRMRALLDALNRNPPARADFEDGSSVVLVVSDVPKGSRGDRAGLQPFDVLWLADGRRISEYDDLERAIGGSAGSDGVEVVVRRYTRNDGRLVVRRDAEGRPILDAVGTPVWDFLEFKFRMKREYFGLGLGSGLVPSPLEE
jgi:hypothetical protein